MPVINQVLRMKAASLPTEFLLLQLPQSKTGVAPNFLDHRTPTIIIIDRMFLLPPTLHDQAASPGPVCKSSRPSISDNRPTTPTRTGSPFKRKRTLSQPKLMELDITAPSRPDVPTASSNATRPSDVKPTRIPVPRTRTASNSGQVQALGPSRTESRNGGHSSHHNLHSGGALGSVTQQQQQQQRHPRMRGVSIDSTTPRPSIDSEERPFEHWYRGEVSRNGGVDETSRRATYGDA